MYILNGENVDSNNKEKLERCIMLIYYFGRSRKLHEEYIKNGGKLSYNSWRNAISCRYCLAVKELFELASGIPSPHDFRLMPYSEYLKEYSRPKPFVDEKLRKCSKCKALEENKEATALRIEHLEHDLLHNPAVLDGVDETIFEVPGCF